MFLKQSTSQTVRFGPFLDSTDGVTAETALTIAQADMQLSKDGGAFAQKNASGNATHDTDGWYSTTLNATDTNTVGELYMQVNVSGSIPGWVRWWVIEESIYDALLGASAAGFDSNQRVDVGEWLGTAVTTSATTSKPEVDVNSISDDATAANNMELAYDGSGRFKPDAVLVTTITVTSQTNITLAAGSSDDDAYNNMWVLLIDSATDAQTSFAVASDYTGSTKVMTLAQVPDFTIATGDTIIIMGPAPVQANSVSIGNELFISSGGVDVQAIDGNTAVAATLKASMQATVTGSCEGTPTTTVIHTDLAEATDDHYIGRVVVFTSGDAAGQATDITDYTGSTGTITVTALTTAPSASDTFVIV